MTLIELNLFASPLGGLIGGVTAAKGLPWTTTLTAAAGGLLVGVGLFFALFGLTFLLALNEKRDATIVDKAASWTGAAGVLLMLVLPLVSGFAAHWLIHTIYR